LAPTRSLCLRVRLLASTSRVQNEKNMCVVDLDADVLVAGGGLAGVYAAIAAARHGARVVLVQDRSRPGGNSFEDVR
jgi:NADPH-dependent 2,4-dienoyl-CoA reductase/sulfur reductase-like enzyme